ncbi:hypothetical protein KJA13_02305 [Patescibacteria group bacterium]|nr:hypothetical protein [Patescibacteria group bacterium]
MQVFELHFNPKLKEDQIFDSFIYEPENIYEKNLGNLYVVGELRNVLPQNLKLLDDIAKAIKKSYYTFSQKFPEKALSQSLKKTNEYLAEKVKKENVSWLGNLNFAVFSLKDFNLIFTKTGDIKILLLRAGQIIDIGKNLDLREIEPYPLKIFLNVVSGKLTQDDKILVLTKEIFEFFLQQNLLTKIAQSENINGKKIKEILPSSLFTKGEGSKVSGTCLLSVVKTEPTKRGKAILFQSEKKFSFPKIRFPFKLPKIIKKPNLPKIKLPKIKIPTPGPIIEKLRPKTNIKKKLILILVLASVLLLGFLIFKQAVGRKEKEIRTSLAKIQEKVNQAESFLIFKNEEEANSLFKEAWKEILPLTETKTSDIIDLKQSIEENLENLNKLEKIENPELVNEPDSSLFSSPSSSLVDPPSFEFNFDLSASYLSNLYFLDKKTCEIIKYSLLGALNWGSPKKWTKDKGPCSEPKSMTVDGSVWILNEDNSVLRYYAGSFQETIIPDFFPFPENITQIKTKADIPYLYLLEPVKNRVVIIDKKGKIIKQFQSQKFDNLKDLDISSDNKTIHLLNNSEVYKIEMN